MAKRKSTAGKARASLILEAKAGAAGAAMGSMDSEVVAVFQDSGKKAVSPKGAYAPLVDRLRKGDAFVARCGSTQYVRFGGKGSTESVLFVGFGPSSELTEEKARVAGAHAWNKLVAEKAKVAAVQADSLARAPEGARGIKTELSPARIARAFAEGMALCAYQFNKHKSGPKADYVGPERLVFVTTDKGFKSQLDAELARVTEMAAAVKVTRDWSNEPSNFGTPEYYAAESKRHARELGLKCTILTERDCAREKMGLLLGVGQGAVREGRVVMLEYAPKGVKNPKTLALVGKGVTFDSGGISIKPSTRMEEMKHDMTGAATVMGAVLLAARWKLPTRVLAIMAFTENMPDGDAIQPGNVLTSRAGKTVEIINTDAEGRLVLADVLDYIQDYEPDAVIDVATLTGAVSIALGKLCCGLMGNDSALVESLRRAGELCGERLWELPTYDEYFDDMKSDTADMKNSCNDSYGGTIRGAMFLKQFIRKGMPWAHLDIAAVGSNMGHVPYFPRRGASGAIVRTLAQFAAEF